MPASGDRLHVCLIAEGSYPYAVGGTATWTQQLIETLDDVDFSVVALCAEPKQPKDRLYPGPNNLRAVHDVVIGEQKRSLEGSRTRRNVSIIQSARIAAQQAYTAMLRGDWLAFKRLYRALNNGLNAEDVFRSPWHWGLLERYYRALAPTEPFLPFYTAWRYAHYLFYQLARYSLPPADIYHPIAAGYAGFLGVCGKVESGTALVLTEHGLYSRERELELAASPWLRGYQRPFMASLFEALSQLAYAHADVIVSLFESAREQQLDLGAESATTAIVPNGVDSARFASLPVRARDGMVRIGLIGRVVPIKDVIAFIESAKVIAETLPNAEFEVVGPVDDDLEYAARARALVLELRLEDRFVFSGMQAPEHYLSRLDIVVATSLKESQPLSILEAMAAALPVVATRTGSLPEMLEGIGMLVWPRDIQGFSEAIIQLARDENKRRLLGEAGRNRVRQRYDQSQNLRCYRDVYERALERAHQAVPAQDV